MQDLKKLSTVKTDKLTNKTVTVFIQSNILIMSGEWEWELNSDAVFCSDVIATLPSSFEGTKGIIHPDDLSSVKELTSLEKTKIGHLEFRIITTYGEIKTLSCNEASVEHKQTDREIFQAGFLQLAVDEQQWKKEYESLQQVKEIYEKTEKFTGTGIWYYNSVTSETWYSSHIFRIYNLPPQSLNAHLNTFTSFIHPEDKEQVIEFTARAYKQKAPLHIQYRINTTAGEKLVLSTTHWFFNTKGEEIMSGSLQDITEQKKWEQSLEEAEDNRSFLKQQLLLDEQHSNIAHWQVHLLTRKTIYSDNLYRIYGLKPQSVPAGINSFLNYVHPEDRDLVSAAHKKMIYEHKAPELDYRIIRSDGKLRYISQKAKLVTYGYEMVIAGVVQDVTVQKTLEKKINELVQKEAIKNFTIRGTEEMAGIATWVCEVNSGEVTWSESFYKLLGYKPNTVELTQKLLLAFIHPEDQKLFRDQQNLVLEQKQETEFQFRLIQRGTIKFMRASFRLMQNQEVNLFVATVQDISKEYLLQQQLKQRMQLAEALSENMLDRVIITDLSNNILSWNMACERVYAITKEDAIGSNFFDVFPQLKTEEELQFFSTGY